MSSRPSLTNLFLHVLIFYCYYEGLCKMVGFSGYQFWLSHAPVIKQWTTLLSWVIPLLHLLFAFGLWWSKSRKITLISMLLAQVVFIAYVAFVFYGTSLLFWPFDVVFASRNWFYKFLECLAVAWLAYLCLLQHNKSFYFEIKSPYENRAIAEHPLKK